eukprot:scaffold92593_cov51-Phaeocystis_antarctica.AAC.2
MSCARGCDPICVLGEASSNPLCGRTTESACSVSMVTGRSGPASSSVIYRGLPNPSPSPTSDPNHNPPLTLQP